MGDAVCPHCGLKLVRPFGRPRSSILLVGEAPGYMEIMEGQCFVGPTGDVLKQELQRVGISYQATRMTNLWLHSIPGKGTGELKKLCFDYCLAHLMDQISTAKAVLLMGAELAQLFAGKNISRINGARVTSLLVGPETVVICAYNPAIVLQESGVVGDFRFAIQRFYSYTQEIYKEMLNAR